MPQEKTRPGFMLYFCDWDMPRKILDAVDFKVFFDAVFNYAQNGEIPPPFSNHIVQVFFDSFMEKMNADNERYEKISKERSIASMKSHKARASKCQQMQQLQANAANTNTNPSTSTSTNTKNNSNPNPDYNNSNDINMDFDYQYASRQTQANAEDDLPF